MGKGGSGRRGSTQGTESPVNPGRFRLLHKIVSAEQAKELSRGIANRRVIDALLKDWERITAEVVLGKSK